VLAATAPDLTPPVSVRSTGVAPEIRTAASGHLVDEVAATVSSLSESVEGNLAVIAPVVLIDDIGQQLGLDVDPRDLLGEARVLLTPEAVKGLEFDAVVVVEPALIVGESPSGLRSLYVAMTRPTQRLAVVHERPLPPPLR
jgi:DNA helicase IV